MMVLHLLQVLGCSVLMDLRNRATHFALFTTVSELKIRFFAMHQHTIGVSVTTIKWQPEQSEFLDIPPQIFLFSKFLFSTLLHCYRELLLSYLSLS